MVIRIYLLLCCSCLMLFALGQNYAAVSSYGAATAMLAYMLLTSEAYMNGGEDD